MCAWRVLSNVCEASGVVLFALRESLKVLTEGETFSLTMTVQLLLLLALVGPFCGFTRASK